MLKLNRFLKLFLAAIAAIFGVSSILAVIYYFCSEEVFKIAVGTAIALPFAALVVSVPVFLLFGLQKTTEWRQDTRRNSNNLEHTSAVAANVAIVLVLVVIGTLIFMAI